MHLIITFCCGIYRKHEWKIVKHSGIREHIIKVEIKVIWRKGVGWIHLVLKGFSGGIL
jgi:hypothetical protein